MSNVVISDLFQLAFKRLNNAEEKQKKRTQGLRAMMGQVETLAHRVIAMEKRIAALEEK